MVVHGSPRSDMEFVTRTGIRPTSFGRILETLDRPTCSSPATPTGRCGIAAPSGLVVNPGSVVSAPVVETSRTFAVVDLDELSVTFHDVETGTTIPLDPWE